MNDFCKKCGCHLDETMGVYCDDCLEKWAEENEVYL
jgi:hypothetical protein